MISVGSIVKWEVTLQIHQIVIVWSQHKINFHKQIMVIIQNVNHKNKSKINAH